MRKGKENFVLARQNILYFSVIPNDWHWETDAYVSHWAKDDGALVTLPSPVVFTQTVRPVCLPDPHLSRMVSRNKPGLGAISFVELHMSLSEWVNE